MQSAKNEASKELQPQAIESEIDETDQSMLQKNFGLIEDEITQNKPQLSMIEVLNQNKLKLKQLEEAQL